jgi:hypothetical protein
VSLLAVLFWRLQAREAAVSAALFRSNISNYYIKGVDKKVLQYGGCRAAARVLKNFKEVKK